MNASARYGTATAPVGATADPEIWGAGLSLGFSGFTIGGSFAEQDGSFGAFQNSMDGSAFDVGIGYANGPWSYSLTYFEGNNVSNLVAASREELQTVIAAAKYKVADNFSVGAFIADTEWTETVSAATVDGTVLGVSAQFSF